MAETKKPRKEHTIVDVGDQPVAHNIKDAGPVGNATGLRIGAVVLWVVAFGLEILALLMLNGTVAISILPTLYQVIIALVLDLACVIIGSQLWKKANHIKPASEKNKLLFWLWNNMGVIACVIAFVPFIILLLTNKNVDGKTKKIASIVAIVALLIGGISSYDFNPISAEEKEAAVAALGETTVYWTQFGKVYHTHEDCQALNRTDELKRGTVETAIASNKTRLCKFCESRDEQAGSDLLDSVTSSMTEPGNDPTDAAPAA